MRHARIVRVRLITAWVFLAGGSVGWPLSALTLARHEPQFVLGLSWLAIIIEGLNGVQIAYDAHQGDS